MRTLPPNLAIKNFRGFYSVRYEVIVIIECTNMRPTNILLLNNKWQHIILRMIRSEAIFDFEYNKFESHIRRFSLYI